MHLSFLITMPVVLVSLARSGVIYSQPVTTDDANVEFGWYSSSEPRPTRNFKHADNFMLDTRGSISSVRWWGMTEGINQTDLRNFDSFTIELYNNRTLPNGNIRPLELITTQTMSIETVGTMTTGRSAPSGALEYMHEGVLSQAWTLDAGVMYWISISARSIDPSGDVWQWQDSDDFDTRSSSFNYAQNRWLVLQDTDSAFELISVPSPGAWAGFAAMGLLAQRRRRAWR